MTRGEIAGFLFFICMFQMFASACTENIMSLACAAIGMVIAKFVVDGEQ